jgi:hypothetical protein
MISKMIVHINLFEPFFFRIFQKGFLCSIISGRFGAGKFKDERSNETNQKWNEKEKSKGNIVIGKKIGVKAHSFVDNLLFLTLKHCG